MKPPPIPPDDDPEMSLTLDLDPAVGEDELGELLTIRTKDLEGEKTATLFVPEPPPTEDDKG